MMGAFSPADTTRSAAFAAGELPRGAVVELASAGPAHATRLALWHVAAETSGGRWCGWIDPGATLYAPAVAEAGVRLDRLLVVRPPEAEIARVAVKMAHSGALTALVVDRAGVAGARVASGGRWPIAVRRLALAAERFDLTILLLSELGEARAYPLPVAMRIEVGRPAVDRLGLRLTKAKPGIAALVLREAGLSA